jgi:hypothetical protein
MTGTEGGEDMTDTMKRLESAGFSVSRMPEEQQAVLADLSDEEVRVLTSIKQRLDATTDVEGHAARRSDDGYVFW